MLDTPAFDVNVLVLAGGLGTRLRDSYSDGPKVLAPVAGKPFLWFMLKELERQGIPTVHLALGYQANKVLHALEEFKDLSIEIIPIVEAKPLGTLGAVSYSIGNLAVKPLIVLNGDTWVDLDLAEFIRQACTAKVLMALTQVSDASRYGSVSLDSDLKVTNFKEKNQEMSVSGLINAGVYRFSADAVKELAKFYSGSLEKDYFMSLKSGDIQGFIASGRFIDIGTQQSYQLAQTFFKEVQF